MYHRNDERGKGHRHQVEPTFATLRRVHRVRFVFNARAFSGPNRREVLRAGDGHELLVAIHVAEKKCLIETGEQCEGWQGNCCVKTLQRGIADSACSNAKTLTQTW